MQIQELRHRLLKQFIARLESLEQQAGMLTSLKREPDAFSLTRHGHFLAYRAGPWDKAAGGKVGEGEMLWKPQSNQNRPFTFRIVCDTADPAKLRINNGPPMAVNQVIDNVLATFLGRAIP